MQDKSTDLVNVKLKAKVTIGTPNKISNAMERPEDRIIKRTLDPIVSGSGCKNSLRLVREHRFVQPVHLAYSNFITELPFWIAITVPRVTIIAVTQVIVRT